MVEEPRRDRAGRRGGADRDRHDVARLVGRVGRAVLAEGAPLALVEGDEDGGRPALVGGAVQDLRQLVLQPQVAGLDGRRVRAVVHVVHRVTSKVAHPERLVKYGGGLCRTA